MGKKRKEGYNKNYVSDHKRKRGEGLEKELIYLLSKKRTLWWQEKKTMKKETIGREKYSSRGGGTTRVREKTGKSRIKKGVEEKGK